MEIISLQMTNAHRSDEIKLLQQHQLMNRLFYAMSKCPSSMNSFQTAIANKTDFKLQKKSCLF